MQKYQQFRAPSRAILCNNNCIIFNSRKKHNHLMNKSLDLKGPVKCLKLCISHQIQNFLRQGGAAPMQTPPGLNDSSYIAVHSQTSSLKLTECSISISICIWLVHRSLLFTCSYVFTVVLLFSNFFVCY